MSDLTNFLQLTRRADTSQYFLYSLRLDTAVQAAKTLFSDLSGDWDEKCTEQGIFTQLNQAVFGRPQGDSGWPGLFHKHFSELASLREVPWDGSGGDALHAPLNEVMNWASSAPPSQQIRDVLSIFREELESKRSDGSVGPKSAQALDEILNHIQTRLVAKPTQDGDMTTVISTRLRPVIESQTMRPYLAQVLGVRRPKSLLQRVQAIADILVLVQLYDRNLTPLPIAAHDLPNILVRLRNETTDATFRKIPRQRQTLNALIDFWEDLDSIRDDGGDQETTIRLPPLVTWSRRVHVDSDVLQLLKDRLGMDATAAHNCVKRQLPLLDAWGFVKEYSDG